jgi:hypothetical protein
VGDDGERWPRARLAARATATAATSTLRVRRAGAYFRIMHPVKALRCCRHVSRFAYADETRQHLSSVVDDELYMAEAMPDRLRLDAIAAESRATATPRFRCSTSTTTRSPSTATSLGSIEVSPSN